MARSEVWVDLQRPDGTTISVLSLEGYLRMTADEVADTVPQLFARCYHGARCDLGTLAELARALGPVRS